MNDGFLLADCAFNFLISSGFVHQSDWKRETKELYYTAHFVLNAKRTSIVSFEVTVAGGRHRITKSIIRCLEKRYAKDFHDVLVKCAIIEASA